MVDQRTFKGDMINTVSINSGILLEIWGLQHILQVHDSPTVRTLVAGFFPIFLQEKLEIVGYGVKCHIWVSWGWA